MLHEQERVTLGGKGLPLGLAYLLAERGTERLLVRQETATKTHERQRHLSSQTLSFTLGRTSSIATREDGHP